MAGELPHYTQWLRQQPCAVCGTTFQVQPHHSLYGTTYSPDEPKPPKAFEGARKGGAQRSHDYFAIPLCLKDHEPGVHQLGGFFEGWSRHAANDWEEARVAEHRARYAPAGRPGEPKAAPAMPVAARRSRAPELAGWTVARVIDLLRREAAQQHRTADAAAALNDVADLVEGRTF